MVKFLREGLDFSTPAGRLAATVFAAMAELERELIRERAAAGRAAAKARGRQLGSPPVLDAEQVDLACKVRASGEPVAVIARTIDTSRATIYRWTEAVA